MVDRAPLCFRLSRRSHSRRLLFTLACGLALAVQSALAFAQATITVRGVVRDASGGVVREVAIEAIVSGRIASHVISDSDGTYRLAVPAGEPFALRAHRDGFADQVYELRGTSTDVTRDIDLPVGTVSDTLIVTAARGLESRTNATQAVSVATRADLEALGSVELADVLRFMPGTSVEGTGREGGGPTSLFVRGGDSDYNVVLIDGVRVNIDGGRFDFSRVAAGEIERVEVVRGAQSSLWGADAMTSVVQIFTRRAQPADNLQFSGSFEAGSFNTARAHAGLNGGAGSRVDYRAGITSRRTDGAFADILPEDDRYRQTAIDAAAGMSFGPTATLRGGVRYSDGDGRNVGPVTYGSRNTGGVYDTRDLSVYGTVSHSLGTRYTGSGTVNYFRYRNYTVDSVSDGTYSTYAILAGTPNALYPNGTRLVRLIDQAEFDAIAATGGLPGPGQFLASSRTTNSAYDPIVTNFRRPAVRYQGDYAWAARQRLTVGYDWERETNPSVEGFELDNNGFFIQQQTTVADRWFITVGGRIDSKESYDTFFSPKLSVGGYLRPHTRGLLSSVKLFGNVGRGVKSPTFGERFGGPYADPNPDIKVEKATSGDVGVEATFADQRFRATGTYFRNSFTDQISYRPGVVGDGIPESINIDGSKASGLELELAVQRPIAGFTVGGTYSLVDTEVVTNQSTSQQFQPGQPLLRRPKHSGAFRASYGRGPVTVNFNLRAIGDRFDNSFLFMRTSPNAERPNSMTTDITINPGYVVAGLGVDVRAHDLLTLYVRADNIGDTAYDFALGYPGLPRAFVGGVRVNVRPRR